MHGRTIVHGLVGVGWRQSLLRVLALAALLAGSVPAEAMFASFAVDPDAQDQGGASGRQAGVPTLAALPLQLKDRIEIDGRLDDAAWSKAPAGSGFLVWDPNRGGLPSEETVFKVAYDSDAIYFGVACLEKDPSQISKRLSRRDNFSSSDLVSIYIDPYHDMTTGYNFRTNPLGVQEDSYIYNDGDRDTDWDAVWQAETYQDEHGWYAELRIPFSSIRYRQDATSWGLQVYRYMHGRGEDTAWVTWDREVAGFVSRFGSLTGLRNIPAPRQLELMPYTVSRTTDYALEGPEERDNFANLGMDLKYGLTADLTLNAAIQPDFGQVEADPALLNLSPYETFFQEKRPFFVEGNRFFQHPEFTMFYSRRIGTGDENARIRYAAKLTGKTAGDISIAALAAATDITATGQTHNLLKGGRCAAQYFVGRVGKEFAQGNHRVNLMQTAAIKSASREECGDRASREAYTTGMDFMTRFHHNSLELNGCFVGSIIEPEPLASDPSYRPAKSYGSGGELSLYKRDGDFRGSVWGRWETDRLDLNDVGFLSAPDELNAGAWLQYRYNPEGESRLFNQGNFNLNYYDTWMYADRTGYDLHTGEEIWSYRRGHRQMGGSNINGWMQLRNFWEGWFGVAFNPEGSRRFDTRSTVTLADGSDAEIPGGGPLISEPTTWGGWIGFNTDSRKDLVAELNFNHYDDTARNASYDYVAGLRWNQSSAIQHSVYLGYRSAMDDTQHMANYENPGGGIGGVSYVYGRLHRQTLDVTLRTSLLFNRSQSLEVYAQPYLTTGDYREARELARPDSYDLKPYGADGFNHDDRDFTYAAVNLNLVYRWEYRPGSTFYLVWTHSRSNYDERGAHAEPGGFDSGMSSDALFRNEPENVFLAKFSYWIPI